MTRNNSVKHEKSATGRLYRSLAVCALAASLGACASGESARQAAAINGPDAGENPSYDVARQMAANGRHATAIALYRQAYSDGGSIARATILANLAQSFMAIGRYEEAEEVLLSARKLDDERADVHLGLGEVNLAFGRAELALKNFRRAAALSNDPRSLSGSAIALDALGRHDAALSQHARAVRTSGGSADVKSNLALSHALHDELDEAISLLKDVVASDDATVQHRQNLALAYSFAGKRERALEMAAVDLDAASARATVGYFEELATLSASERVNALLLGAQNPQQDLSDTAVIAFDETQDKQRAGAKLVAEPEPEPEPVAPPPPPPAEPEPKPEPEPEPEPEPLPEGLPPLVEPEGWSVQVAAYRTAKQLIYGQKYYWDRYADILGPLPPRRSEIDFGDRSKKPRGFFYRLNAGPLRDIEEAREVCAALKAVGAPCWIRPPEPPEGRLPEALDEDSDE